MTKASLKGTTHKCLRIVKGLSIEDIPAMRKQLKQAEKDNKGAILTETNTSFEFNNGQFYLKPKQHRETTGFIVFGPSFAKFNGVRIEYKNMDLDGDYAIFETDNAKYSLQGKV